MTSLRDVRGTLQALAADLRHVPDAQLVVLEAVDSLVDIEVALTAANEQLKEFLRREGHECPDLRL